MNARIPVPDRLPAPPEAERVAVEALGLLRSGRTGMAAAALAQLPALIRQAVQADRTECVALDVEATRLRAERDRLAAEIEQLRRSFTFTEADIVNGKLARLEPSALRPHEKLGRALLDGAITVEEAAVVLRMPPPAVERLVKARTTMSATRWERMMRNIR